MLIDDEPTGKSSVHVEAMFHATRARFCGSQERPGRCVHAHDRFAMMRASADKEPARTIGRYVLFHEVAHGGMATVHLARLRGPAGFARTVAIKRLHPAFARNPEFVAMFLDEARMAARIQHPHVVSVLDVVAADGELFLVMDYVHGESLQKLLTAAKLKGIAVPPRIVNGIVTGVLYGLHAAHEARSERGDPLYLVHRDVSPQNVLVGVDGVARVLDFGIAKATMRVHEATRDGQLKGKIPYMAPEQLAGSDVDRRADVYAAAVMLWEGLAGERLFPPADTFQIATLVMSQMHAPPSSKCPEVTPALDAIALKGLARDPANRYASAHEMALALEATGPTATTREIGEWAAIVADDQLRSRAITLAEIEGTTLPKPQTTSDYPRGLPKHLDSAHLRASSATTIAPPSLAKASTEAVSLLAPLVVLPPPPGVPVVASATPSIDEDPKLPVPRWASRRVAVVAALGLLVIFAVAGAVTCAGSRDPPSQAVISATVAASAVPTPSSMPPPSAPMIADSAIAPPPTSVAPPPVATSPAPRSTATMRTPPQPARPPPPSRADCNPPYTIDGQGVKVPKRQCF